RRWAPDVVRLRAELAAGKWGSVRAVSATYNKGIVNNGSHLIDLLHFLLDRRLDLVAAGAPLFDFWPEDPTIPAMLVTDDGVPVQLGVAHAADFSLFELQIVTSLGVIAMLDGGSSWQFREVINSPDFKGYRALDAGERHPGELAYAMSQAYGNIANALAMGAPLASNGRSALMAQRLCQQIRTASFAGGRQQSA
ncbi:MAG TPA: hypothetical protein PKE25_02635, partial [Novosphingobium sp.]|nr:hypothetical protein [Novosphingobium sp.]